MASRTPARAFVVALTAGLLLVFVGCDDSNKKSSASSPPPASSDDPQPGTVVENRITGSVGDGPIVGARVRVRANTGQILQELESSDTADYDVTIRTQGKNYVLTVEADRGTDLVTGGPPDFRLVSGIVRPNKRSIGNLNPYTTLIFGAARQNGGVSDATVAALGWSQAIKALLPAVERLLGDAQLSGDLTDRGASLVLLQRERDLRVRKLRLLHRKISSLRGTERRGLARLNKDAGRLHKAIARRLALKAERLDWQVRRLTVAHPGNRLRQLSQRLDELELRLRRAVRTGPERLAARTDAAARTRHMVCPLATLERGYAIVARVPDGAILREAGQVEPGDGIEITLARGSLWARVTRD